MSAIIQQLERKPDPDVVTYLERVLEAARAGEITGVLILAQDAGGVSYGIAGLEGRYTVLGFLSHAMHRLQTDPD